MYAQIVIDFATVSEIDRLFTYKIGANLLEKVKIGMRVKVPFGRGTQGQIGYIIAIVETLDQEVSYAIKEIWNSVDEEPLLSEEQIKCATFIARYYGCTLAASISAVLPPGLTHKPLNYIKACQEYIVLSQPKAFISQYIEQNLTQKRLTSQRLVLEYCLQYEKVKEAELLKTYEITKSPIRTLLKKGLIKKVQEVCTQSVDAIQTMYFKQLNEEQVLAYNQISAAVASKENHTILLQGVTGSGKTEVFLYAIKDVIEQGGTAIVLVPEIALTRQTLQRFVERFGNRVALTHSRMTPKERQQLYFKAKKGEISIIVGPRSAVFAPLENVKLIVIDEEHESTYKSETVPKYSAIEVAKYRMACAKGVVVLASATPSLESYYLSKQGAIEVVKLEKRVGVATLPKVEIADMRLELQQGNHTVISRILYEAIKNTLEQNNQVMLLLNRRGHSTFVNCRSCGYVVKCKHCDIAMTYHRGIERLECHYCGNSQLPPQVCPSCGSKHIRFFGNGTEKVEEYLKLHFDAYGVGRMDFDTTSGKHGHDTILKAFNNREINVLIGTQMISKGHDFPNVTLVGIIAADQSLYMQDFRCDEKSFQLITQTLGRAGRAEKKGQVIIQTYNPEHPVIGYIKSFKQETFYENELRNRENMQYPPFTHLFSLLVTGKSEQEVITKTHTLTQYYAYYNKKNLFKIIGPASATVGKVADEYRWKLIILGEEREKVLIYGKYCLDKFLKKEASMTLKIQWDIDPIYMI